MNQQDIRIETHFQKEKLAAGGAQTVDVLVRIIPPDVDLSDVRRPSLNFGLALDRSGSMRGAKMREAIEAAKYCVDQMLPSDRFSCVIFDDSVDVLYTSQPVQEREMLKRGLDRIRARNSTALHQGWVQAGLQVSEHLDPAAINRVLLITDGQANVGETNPACIIENARSLALRGIGTSTIGIGADFNEDLLLQMAEAGEGNAWHVQEPDDMRRIFETELNGLLMQFGNSVTLEIDPSGGVLVQDLLNELEKDEKGRYKLPNLVYGSPLDIVVRLELPPAAIGDAAELAAVKLRCVSQASNQPLNETVRLCAEFESPEIVEALPPNKEVIEAVTLLMNAHARKEMIRHMDAGRHNIAMDALFSIAEGTRSTASRLRSAKLAEEVSDLDDLQRMFRNDDINTRKRMAYRRESMRKSKSYGSRA